MTVSEVRSVLRHVLALRQWNEELIVEYCNKHQQRKLIAKQCHERRRKKELRKAHRLKKSAVL